MTGDNNTPQQWPAEPTTPEPTPKRRSRAEAASQSAAAPEPAPKTRASTPRSAASTPEVAPEVTGPLPSVPQAAPATPRPSPASAPDNGQFGNGNIFGEAFATLLDQVEAAKRREREEEERAAQEALARALAEKVKGAQGAAAPVAPMSSAAAVQAVQPAPVLSPQPVPTQMAAPQTVAAQPTVAQPAASDFAAQIHALQQARAASVAPTPAPAPIPAPVVAQDHVIARTVPVEVVPASLSQAQLLQTQPLQTQPAAPLVSEVHYIAEPQPVTHHPAPASNLVPSVSDVPPEVLAQPPVIQTESPHADIPTTTQPLSPKFASSGPFLSRFLPDVPSSQTGILAGFCDLHDFLGYLHEQNWYGYLYAALGEQAAYVLVYEGRTVAAACLSSTGEQALGELLHLYEQGARLSAYPLEPHLAHILSGVGSRAWKFNLTDDFTGLHAQPEEAAYYYQGRVVATMPVGLPYEGAFPAPLRPQTLVLPRSLAGWAHHSYTPTLRGRDALNAITPAHQAFKAKFGAGGLVLQAGLIEGLTPAEYALRHDTPLHELEPIVLELVQLGYLKDE